MEIAHGLLSRRFRALWTMASLASLLTACEGSGGTLGCNEGGSPNSLSGSYCEGLSLPFTDVALLLVTSSQTLRIEYINETRSNKTLRLLVSPTKVPLAVGTEINLVEAGAVVQRFPPGSSEINLTSELDATSTLSFDAFEGKVGTPASGEFHILFKSGRTLSGTFAGDIVDALAAAQDDE